MARRSKRSVDSYLKSARELSNLAPSLRKYKRRKSLSRWEKAAITRKEKFARNIHKIKNQDIVFGLTKKQFRKLKDKDSVTTQGGFRFVRARDVQPDAKLSVIKGEIVIKTGGRQWLYVAITPTLDNLLDGAQELIERPNIVQINLWTTQGRIGRGFDNWPQFAEWLLDHWQSYTEQAEWINGIAALKA